MEDLAHILLPRCPQLQDRKDILIQYALDRLEKLPTAAALFERLLFSQDTEKFVQFVLDPSAVQEVISAVQLQPDILSPIFRVTTTWCYAMHRTRLKLLGKWT